MMFGYEVNEHVTLKILEEREAEQLFKLVDSNRDYLGEFLHLSNIQLKLRTVRSLFSRH